ncbi:hypothetical protein DFH28DRAFT_1136359 [Melampsora americana]|nr:hypothetical protein DFH28DRAFT_1136359 [Melampsora americana]
MKKNGKKGRKVEKVVLPEGVQEEAVQWALWDAETAGDLMYEGNPYTPGQPKFGDDFHTVQPVERSPLVATLSKGQTDHTGKGKDGGGDWSGNQFRRKKGGDRGHTNVVSLQHPRPYFKQQHHGGYMAQAQNQPYAQFVPNYSRL